MTTLVECVYTSVPTSEATLDLTALLADARPRNRGLDVTGMLLYDGEVFVQVLEGPPAAVYALFDRIEQDPRHRLVTRLLLGPIAHRRFAGSDMGYRRMARSQALDEIPREAHGVAALRLQLRSRARTLLAAHGRGLG